MAMYKCLECGNLFEDGEQAEWVEMHGFTYGNGEKFYGCPLCKGGFEEILPCKNCGSYKHDIEKDYCKECVELVENKFKKFIYSLTDEEAKIFDMLVEEDKTIEILNQRVRAKK